MGRGWTVAVDCGLVAAVVRRGVGEPVRGSGCQVRVGVVVRGGVLERLLRGVPPMGEGNVGGACGCSGRLTLGVGMRLTYCHRSCGCLLVADVGLGEAVGSVLLAVGMEVAG